MPTLIRNLIIAILCCIVLGIQAQENNPKIKKKTEELVRYSGLDSFPRHAKEWHYDEEERITYQKEYIYSTSASDPPGTLASEKKVSYNDETQLWVSVSTTYKKNKDPETEKLKIKYLTYSKTPNQCKPVWTQKYDKTDDIIKEDTITYNDQQQIIQSCTYSYSGSTSLFCDHFEYNKKGLRKKWFTYYKWTTINGRSQVVERSKKRRNYKYKYNKNNQLVRGKGRYYKTKYKESRTYDKNGQLASVEISKLRKTKHNKKRRKETGKRFFISGNTRSERYENGKLVYLKTTENSTEKRREEYVYTDSLLTEYTLYINSNKNQIVSYEYNNEGILKSKETDKYDARGKMSYTLYSSYNEAGKPVKEVQKAGDVVLSTIIMEYDEYNNLIYHTMYLKNDIKFEKTSYIYTYYAEE